MSVNSKVVQDRDPGFDFYSSAHPYTISISAIYRNILVLGTKVLKRHIPATAAPARVSLVEGVRIC